MAETAQDHKAVRIATRNRLIHASGTALPHARWTRALALACVLAIPAISAYAQSSSSLPTCPDPGMCFASQAAKAAWAAAQGCSFADQNQDKSLSDAGETLLKGIEGLALQPYDDQTGKPITKWVEGATIGYGHLIKKSEWDLYKNGITQAQAEQLFDDDLAPFVATVNKVITVDVTQQQFDALVLLAYNIGTTGFSGSSVVKLINDPNADTDYGSLEEAWKSWKRSQGKVNQGLINRRASEWDIYTLGIYERW